MSEACQQFQSTIGNFRIVQCDPHLASQLRIIAAEMLAAERIEMLASRCGAAQPVALTDAGIEQLEATGKGVKNRMKGGQHD